MTPQEANKFGEELIAKQQRQRREIDIREKASKVYITESLRQDLERLRIEYEATKEFGTKSFPILTRIIA